MGKVVGRIFAPAAETFICPVCGKEYKSQNSLAKHIEEKHSQAANGPGNSTENPSEE